MKVNLSQNISEKNLTRTNHKSNNKSNNVSFKGAAGIALLEYLATNPVWGATATDVLFMGTPTTSMEIYKRGWGYGAEAGFREYTSTLNDASIGLYGLGAGTVIAQALRNKGLKDPQRIFASHESVDVHSSLWKTNNGDIDKYIADYVDNIKGFNPNSEIADTKGFVKIADEYKKNIIDDMKTLATGNLTKKERENVTQRLNARLIEATGSESELLLSHGGKSTSAAVTTITDDFYRMTKAFREHNNVANTDKLVSSLKKFGKNRAVLGLGAAIAISACFQPINVWMTKKRTGSDSFGGDETRAKDTSIGFKIKKLASMAAMATIMLTSMKAKPLQFMDKMMFKGTAPSINQFKGLYGCTIMSRMWMARDNDELREVNTKSILGYLNWLVLGNFVEKGVVMAMQDKNNPILKYNKESAKDGFLYKHFGEKIDKFFNSSITSRREIVTDALKKEGVSVLNNDGTAKNMTKLLKDFEKLTNNPVAKKNLKIKTAAQIANYVYSGIVLGAGIPLLNISITNNVTKKRNAKKTHEEAIHIAQNKFFEKDIKNTSFSELKGDYSKKSEAA